MENDYVKNKKSCIAAIFFVEKVAFFLNCTTLRLKFFNCCAYEKKVLFLMLLCSGCCASCDEYEPFEEEKEEEYYYEEQNGEDVSDYDEDCWIMFPAD